MVDRAVSKIISCNTAGTYTLYTCPLNCRAKIPLIFISNVGSTNTISLLWYRIQDSTNYYIFGGKNMTSGEFVQLSEGYIVMEPGDILKVTINSNGDVHALCTAEEEFAANIRRAL